MQSDLRDRFAARLTNAIQPLIDAVKRLVDGNQLPFGGAKQSGFGKEHGMEAIESYTEKKSVVLGS